MSRSPGRRAHCARAAILGCLTFCLPASARGQHAGLPIDHAPAHQPVVGVHLDFGVGAGYADTGRLLSLGGRVQAMAGPLQFTLGGHNVSPEADGLKDGIGLQATAALQLHAARPARTTNVQVGFGIVQFEVEGGGEINFIDIPVSLGVGIYAPTPVGPAETWIAPRVHFRQVDAPVGDGWRVGPGASAGLRFTHAEWQTGFGLTLDGFALRDPVGSGWRFMGSFALSLHLLLLR